MFRKHTQHLQTNYFDTHATLTPARQARLEQSWAGVFYRELFCRIDEAPFAPLYVDVPSRPHTPINQLVGLEILKSGFGWSDEELFDHLQFDLQVRYALGIRDLTDEVCTLRTVYHFRRRVADHMQTTGDNLFEQVFTQVTDAQLADLQVDTHRQRMDSTQIGSNIRQYSRLHLLVEVLQRAARMLTPADQERYAPQLQPYLRESAGHYCYRLKPGEYATQLEPLGVLLGQLLTDWAAVYADHPAYQLLQRVFHEHFTVAAGEPATPITVKPAAELRASNLQSPDDPEATYRQKQGEGHWGYVLNATETCAPTNPVQLLTHLQLAPNTTDDEDLLIEAVPALQARMPVTDLDLDGGYTGPEATRVSTESHVRLHPTAIRGAQPDPDGVGLADFVWEVTDETPAQVTCPHAQTVPVQAGRADDRYCAEFAAATCATCPLRDRCPTTALSRRPVRVLRVSRRQIAVAQLRRACAETQHSPPHLRPAVEATMRSLKHPFGDERDQLPVRGQARVTMVLIAGGLMVNLRRIWRYRLAEAEKESKIAAEATPNSGVISFVPREWCRWLGRLTRLPVAAAYLGC